MIDWRYPAELQLNHAKSSDTESPILDLNFYISNGTASTKIFDKRGDFDSNIVIFRSLMAIILVELLIKYISTYSFR